jgi:hypothetical protein
MKKVSLALILVVILSLLATQVMAQSAKPKNSEGPLPSQKVGWVTAYTPGVSITIWDHKSLYYTYVLTPDIKILPKNRVGELAIGSRVTILARRDPTTLGWIAFGIVVHPAGSGAGSMPPTPTPVPSITEPPII